MKLSSARLLFAFVLATIGACKEFGEPDPTASPDLQIQVDDRLATLQIGELRLQVDIDYGGRITEFSLGGKNALVTEGKYTGSTFWTSPQKDWDWPPPATIDTAPYAYQIIDNSLELVSATIPEIGVRVEKSFGANAGNNGFEIRYRLRNLSKNTVKLAPWEVTRVSGGYSFYPGSGLHFQSGIPTTDVDGITWFHYQPDNLPEADTHKLYADGVEGWIANANPETELLFVKAFADIDPAEFAPDEAEIEIYASADKNYIEIEQQGAYAAIPPMSAVDWTVTWYLQHLGNRQLHLGNSQLVKSARAAVKAGGNW